MSLKQDLRSSTGSGLAVRGRPVCLQRVLLSDGGSVENMWCKSVDHSFLCCDWSVRQPRRRVKPYRVLQTMKSILCSQCLNFIYCIYWSLLSVFVTSPSLFQPTCQPINIRQMLTSSVSTGAQSGSRRTVRDRVWGGWKYLSSPRPTGNAPGHIKDLKDVVLASATPSGLFMDRWWPHASHTLSNYSKHNHQNTSKFKIFTWTLTVCSPSLCCVLNKTAGLDSI